MTSKYEILFSVDILHDYYKSGICTDFVIKPSEATLVLLRDFGLVYKNVGNRLVILAKVKPAGADAGNLFLELNPLSKFVFYLELMNPAFTSFTNVDLDRLRSQRFYFSNMSQNTSGGTHYLPVKPALFKNTTRYFPGDTVSNPTGNIFECVKETTGNNTSVPEFWTAKTQRATSEDMVRHVISTVNYFDDGSLNFDISIFGFNTASNIFDVPAHSQILHFDTPPGNFDIALPALAKGKYKVAVNADEFFIYVDEAIVYNNFLGVIEIFSHLPATNDFSLIDAAGKPKANEFVIRFANRSAILKYHSVFKNISEINDSLNQIQFTAHPSAANAEYFESTTPVPLMQYPGNFEFVLKDGPTPPKGIVPAPDVRIPGCLTRETSGRQYYCNMYLNY